MVSNRGINNDLITDGRIVSSKSGTEYRLKKFKTVDGTDENGIARVYIGYQVRQLPEDEIIGSVTNYTTESRLHSLLERYENPDHMRPVTFITKVRGNDSRIYCPVGYAKEWAALTIDDSFDIGITTSEGIHVEDPEHHLSVIGSTSVIELTRLRRWSKRTDDKGRHYVHSFKSYARMRPKDREDLLLRPDDLIEVTIIPQPGAQNYFFADNL